VLAISLRPREFVQIGDDIKIYNNGEDHIKLAIDAPREIPITRELAKIKEPKQS
jgi:sRNA-binding carbon storage regulator CsrA